MNRLCIVTCLLSLLLAPALWAAGTLLVSPIRVHLSADSPTAVLSVINQGEQEKLIQLEVVHWTQQNGEDQYQADNRILATPPVFRLPAGESQLIRLGLRQVPQNLTEDAFRIFVREVPEQHATQQALRMALRLGIPIFVAPSAGAQRSAIDGLQWAMTKNPQGEISLQALNQSHFHIQLHNIRLLQGKTELKTLPGMKYLLPGQSYRWRIQPDNDSNGSGSYRVRADSDAGPVRFEIAAAQ